MTPALEALASSPMFVDAMNGMAFLDEDGCFIKANHEFCSIMERTEAELRGVPLSKFVELEDMIGFQSSIDEARFNTEHNGEVVCRLQSKSGRLKPVRMTVKRLNKQDGGFLCYFSQATEIDPIVPRAHRAQTIEWLPFIRHNLRGITMAVIVTIGFIVNQIVGYREMQRTVAANQAAVTELSRSVELIADSLSVDLNRK